MNRLNERKLLRIIKNKYKQRLADRLIEANLAEMDIVDKRGNVLLSRGLKVRHKKSGYVYTVDSVEGTGENTKVCLRHPDEPRVDPGDSIDSLHEDDELGFDINDLNMDRIANRPVDPTGAGFEKSKMKPDHDTITVSKKTFEEEYELA